MKTAATLTVICAIALALRVVPPWHEVFRGDRVVFGGNDAWIHMRNADNIAAHWPLPSWFDPYRVAPEGEWTEAPLMDVAISGIALATRIPLDLVGAWFPAIAGALICIPIFFLTRDLFGDATAVIASILIAILPGSLLQRSVLGGTDHHVLEALLAACVLLFVARGRPIPAGIFLGAYLLTWARGAFLVFILVAWALIARRGRFAAIVFAMAFVIALPVAIHLPPMDLTLPVLAGGAILVLIADRLPRRVVIGLAIAAAIVALIALPDLITQIRRFLPGGPSMMIGEVQPLLWVSGHFTFRPLWFELTTASVLMVIGFVLVIPSAAEREESGRVARPRPRPDSSPSSRLGMTLVLVFVAIVTAATLAQTRFAYYMAIGAAILAAVAAERFLWRGMHRAFGALVIAAIVIYPNVPLAVAYASSPQPGPTDGWLATLDWMRVHTPEPFGSPDVYFARYDSKAGAPAAQYGVMAWSDYGWWIARIARRAPSTNPTQVAVKEAARFYLATSEAEASNVLRGRNARYVIADRSMPMTVEGAGQIMSSQLEPMARWAEQDPSRFYELVWDRGRPVFVYFPDYYRTMAVRLFGYDGRAYTPSGSSWAVAIDADRQLIDARNFATYEDATAFVARDPRRWRLAGFHPLISCVPLDPLTHFAPVWTAPKHDVKIFQFR